MAKEISDESTIMLAKINKKLRRCQEEVNELSMIGNMIQFVETEDPKDQFGRKISRKDIDELRNEANKRFLAIFEKKKDRA